MVQKESWRIQQPVTDLHLLTDLQKEAARGLLIQFQEQLTMTRGQNLLPVVQMVRVFMLSGMQ